MRSESENEDQTSLFQIKKAKSVTQENLSVNWDNKMFNDKQIKSNGSANGFSFFSKLDSESKSK